MTRLHELTDAELAAVATGLGGAAVVQKLMASRLSRHLLLLKYVAEQWREDRSRLDAAVACLAAVQQHRPEVYRHLLGDPLVGAWLSRTARRLRRRPDDRLTDDLLRLGGLAASAAIQAGLEADLTVCAQSGRVTLPGLGEVLLPDGADGPVPIRVRGGEALVGHTRTPVPASSASWRPLRRLTARWAELTCTVTVEDGNPYRDGYHAPPSDRLTPAQVDRWQRLFDQAWPLLARHVPARAAEIGAGLRAVVPLQSDSPGSARSGTARDSVGALGLTAPAAPDDFALTIVHEFQHSKLSAVLDLVDLYVPNGTELHFAPWRTDPRPTGGLIQGVYAFLAMADTWRALRAVEPLHTQATEEFASIREQVHAGLTALESSEELTASGQRFIEHLRLALDPMMGEQLPAPAVTLAHAAIDRRRESWVERHSGRRTTA